MTDIPTIALLAIVAFASFTHGFSGFGYGILFMAITSFMVDDIERPSVFVTVSGFTLLGILIARSWREIRLDWKGVGLVFVGMIVGIPLGYACVAAWGAVVQFRIVFGLALIGFALYGFFKPHVRKHIPAFWAPVFGLASGLLGGMFSSGGPPLVLYAYAREDDPRMAVGSLQVLMIVGAIYKLGVVSAGPKGVAELWIPALFAAPVIVAFALSGFALARKVTAKTFVKVVYALLMAAGLMNVAKGIGVWS